MKYLKNGNFQLEDFEKYNYLYFPLCNHNGMKSSITPSFGGDLKIDQHHFALPPASNIDLLNPNNARNVYFDVNGNLWNITGNTIYQKLNKDKTLLEGGFLYQKVIREASNFKVSILSFVSENKDNMEIHEIEFENISSEVLSVKPCVAIPLYSRSADNIRDHRHVTSLLNRIYQEDCTVYNKPTLSFDERGHVKNETIYQVIVSEVNGCKPERYYKAFDEFIGEGGSIMEPLGLYNDKAWDNTDGFECMAGFRYPTFVVKPGEKIVIRYAICINEHLVDYKILNDFNELFAESLKKWNSYFDNLSIDFANNTIMKWVSIQPVLRRIYGCSFLPHHDYGKGGKGWRDLWQDCLALIKMDNNDVKELLLNNFKGVRMDGSNATIIGDKPGEFKADRNNISRMWMDHGAWPLITLKLYMENNNDYNILFDKVSYFKDSHINFSSKIDWDFDNTSYVQKNTLNEIHEGTVLEHILIQNIPIFFNVGAHNNLKLMGADWNDALDLAKDNGESVAFTALYAHNLLAISNILEKLDVDEIEVCSELASLLAKDYDFNNVEQKNAILNDYFDSVKHKIKSEVISINKIELIQKLRRMFEEIKEHINSNEWHENEELGYYNSYYDNDSKPLGSIEEKLMLLTGQVFTIMGNIADEEKILKITKSADKLLYNPNVGGYLLNNDFNELKMNMGRLFGFAYGHKENGAMFSHMTIMYAYSLYSRGFVKEGYKVINSIFEQIKKFEISKCYPSIPEYFDSNGRGMYPYLTGSASWLILTIIDMVFGVNIENNQLILKPKLTVNEFNNNKATIKTKIVNKVITITYVNDLGLDYGQYQIKEIYLNKKLVESLYLKDINDKDEIVVILSD